MADSGRSGQRNIPHNPELMKLVNGKRKWSGSDCSELQRQGFKGWHERGYLPHRDEPGLIQFVTFNLIDSYPASLRSEWEELLMIENDERRLEKLQDYLDLGRGECLLARSEVADIVDEAIRFHHRVRYVLRAWVVMANHVHVLFESLEKPMGQIIGNWKEFTAKQVNKHLGRGGSLWAADFWDTFMRDEHHELRVKEYIEGNPVKAGLVRDPKEWRWGSARWRDDYGRLVLEQ